MGLRLPARFSRGLRRLSHSVPNSRSDLEGLPAAATLPGVGILEQESLLENRVDEVEGQAVQERVALRVDAQPDAVHLEDLIRGACVALVPELVLQPGAAAADHAEAQKSSWIVGGDHGADPLDSGWGDLDHRFVS